MTLTDFGEAIRDGYRAGRTMVARDTERDADTAENLAAVRAIGVRAWIGVPLVKEGRWVAAVGVHSSSSRDWTPAEIALVEEVGERTWDAVERARIESALRVREGELALTQRIGRIASLDVELVDPPVGHRSPEYRRLHGLPPDRAIERHGEWLARVHPDDREREDREFWDAVARDGEFASEYRIIRPDDADLRWIEARGYIEHDADGRPSRLRGVHIDITDRKLADAALREAEDRQRLMVELVPALLWSVSADGQEVALNDRWLAYTGQSKVETQNFGWLDAVHPDDRAETEAAFVHAFATGEPLERQQRIHRADDGYRWHVVRHVPVHDAGGAIVRWFGAAVDIHDFKLAEQALDASERRLQTLVEGVPQLVWRAVDGGRWTWASPQWTSFTGQPEPESHGHGWLDPVHPDDRAGARRAWAAASELGEFRAEYRVCHAQEHDYRWFQTRALPVRDREGRIVEWLGTSTDIDDLRTLQQRQQVLLAELQHRVRNILTVVRSVFSRTVDTGDSPEEVADHFRGRLDSLARTQVIVTSHAAGLVDLESLIRDELLSVGEHEGARLSIAGPGIALPAKPAESIGLAIHELTTNAVKYGALAEVGAKVEIGWTTNLGEGGTRRLRLTWNERGVPIAAVAPGRRGFGSELIEEALPFMLDAETRLEFRDGGIRCTIDLPLCGETVVEEAGGTP